MSAITTYRARDTSRQPGHCDTSFSSLCESPLRVVFNKQAKKFYSTSETYKEESAWEVRIEREVLSQ
jgi:hypothetical protein